MLFPTCFRFYVLAALWIYHWLKKIFTRALQPLEPVFQQVKKVPKKDISAEGIFYQTLRLQFLLFLYITPFILSAFHYLAQPLVWLRDWLFAFVEEDEKYSKKSTEEWCLCSMYRVFSPRIFIDEWTSKTKGQLYCRCIINCWRPYYKSTCA